MTRTLSRRAFLRTAAASTGATVAAGLGAFAYAHNVEPEWLEISRPELRLPRLDAAFDGYRIAHLTDIHFDNQGMDRARLGEIVGLVNAERPDLIAITGDFVSQHPARYDAWLRDGLAALRAADGVLAIAGNHDYWYDGGIWMPQILAAAGAHWLSDSFLTVRRGAAQLHLAGLDDCWQAKNHAPPLSVHEPRLRRLAAALPAEGAAVLLAHEPDIADVAAGTPWQPGRFDLQLSGHSHGGQVRLPGLGALTTRTALGSHYDRGLFHFGGPNPRGFTTLYVNAGVGTSLLPIRFFDPPTFAVVELGLGAGAAAP